MNEELAIDELDLVELDMSDMEDLDEFYFDLEAGCGALFTCGHCGGC